jgi:NADH:ubiquinone oxidoreductase subunit 6 (subunit J)
MFYLIVATLIVSYYFFMAPKTIRSTLNMIGIVGAVALLLVLAAMSFVKIMQSPPEIFLGLAMVALGFFAIRDVYRLPSKKDEKKHYSKKS